MEGFCEATYIFLVDYCGDLTTIKWLKIIMA